MKIDCILKFKREFLVLFPQVWSFVENVFEISYKDYYWIYDVNSVSCGISGIARQENLVRR